MVRTLWVTNDLPPRAGGIEQFVGNLLARLDPAGTRVLASQWPGSPTHDEQVAYDVRRVGRRPLLPLPALLSLVRTHVDDFAPDVVVFGAAWPLAELAVDLPVPSVALTHGHEAGLVRVGGGPLVRHALRGVAGIGVISHFTATGLRRWVPPGVAVHHVPPGVDTRLFSPATDGQALRDRHGIPRDAPLVGCVARLVRRKGIDVLVRAWPEVARRVPGARLLIGGDGPLAGPLARAVAGRPDILLAGPVPVADLPAFHAAADVFAMPCRTRLRGLDVEGLGIVYLEAQACAVPVVAGRSGGAPEALVDGESGLVVDGSDATEVAGAVVALLADPQRRLAMGRRGRRFVQEHFDWSAVTARFLSLLDAGVAAARR